MNPSPVIRTPGTMKKEENMANMKEAQMAKEELLDNIQKFVL